MTIIYLLLDDKKVSLKIENDRQIAIEWVKHRTFIKGKFLVRTIPDDFDINNYSIHRVCGSKGYIEHSNLDGDSCIEYLDIVKSSGTVIWKPYSYAKSWTY